MYPRFLKDFKGGHGVNTYDIITEEVESSIRVKQLVVERCLDSIQLASNQIVTALSDDKALLLAGNGGSATDAVHIAAEFLGRFRRNRRSVPAIALPANISVVTAIGNDYGYDEIYARQIDGFYRIAGVFMGFSTSGNSGNIVKAAMRAKELGLVTIGFTGEDGGLLKSVVSTLIAVPSRDTARIQEVHIMIGHILSEIAERWIASR